MHDIAGIPYTPVEFDKKGTQLSPNPALRADTTDVFIASHGWNNDRIAAEWLYTDLFTNFAKHLPLPGGRKAEILGVIWPSKKFTDGMNVEASAGGAVSVEPEADATLLAKLAWIGEMMGEDAADAISRAGSQIPLLEDDGAARETFANEVRSLLTREVVTEEDDSEAFLDGDVDEIFSILSRPPRLPAEDDGGGVASMEDASPFSSMGGAALFGNGFSKFKRGAIGFMNVFTYFEMKKRAGVVGAKGVAALINAIHRDGLRVHLVGHSFGGRVVTAAAMQSNTEIRTMALLQTAFSHNGFSGSIGGSEKKGFFRDVVTRARVTGPILVTHTPNDIAVGLYYPVASRLSRDYTAGIGDENDKYGGLGRNGAQQMTTDELAAEKELKSEGSAYQWEAKRFHNLESSQFIVDPGGGDAHGFVTGPEVAWAIRSAVDA